MLMAVELELIRQERFPISKSHAVDFTMDWTSGYNSILLLSLNAKDLLLHERNYLFEMKLTVS